MSRNTKFQLESYKNGVTRLNSPATFKPESVTMTRSSNTPSDTSNKIMGALYDTFNVKLKAEIKRCPDRINYPQLYDNLIARGKLPKYTIDDTATRLGIESSRVQNYLREQVRSTGKQSIMYWREYVSEHFDRCKEEVLYLDDYEDSDDDDDTAYQEIDDYRACTTTYKSIMRKDLKEAEQQVVQRTFKDTIVDTTNYLSDYTIQVLKMALIFTTHTFTLRNREVTLQEAQGTRLEQVLPAAYFPDAITVPAPFDAACFSNDTFKEAFDLLFTHSHFNIVHSSLYGVKGPDDVNRNRHAVHTLISNALDFAPTADYHHLPSHITKLARKTYEISVSNMWSENKRVNKLLRQLIDCLLCVHLRPAAERQSQAERLERQFEHVQRQSEHVQRPAQSDAPPDISFTHKTRNGRRRVITNLKKRRDENLARGNNEAAEQCKDKLLDYRIVMDREIQEKKQLQDTLRKHKQPENTDDTSKKRISTLLNAVRSSLFKETPISRLDSNIQKIKDLTDDEFNAMSRISNFIKPYIPAQDDYHKLQYQLPFLLMANKVLHCTGRSHYCTKILPLVKPTDLHALCIDARTLYRLFCSQSQEQPMMIHAFNGQPLQLQHVESYKDAVFSSFFNIEELTRLCQAHGTQFAQRLHILPGLKTVRVYGSIPRLQHHAKTKPTTSNASDNNDTAATKATKATKATEATTEALRKREEALKVEAATKLTDTTEELKAFVLQNKSPTQMKKDCRKGNAQLDDLQRVKQTKSRLQQAVRDAKQDVQTHKRAIFMLNNPNEKPAEAPDLDDEKYEVYGQACMKKAEDCKFHADFDLENAVFAGSDNGIVKTTETVAFDLHRFAFHLELFIRFQGFDEADPMPIDNADAQSLSCMKLPSTHTIGSAQISQETGLRTYNKALKKSKNMTTLGKQAALAEQRLSANSLHTCSTPDELETHATIHRQERDVIRSFYYSDLQTKKRHKYVWTKQRGQDRLAAEERSKLTQRDEFKTYPVRVIFIGDRGHGYNSPIKGHLRFGGHWKEKKHSHYKSVIVTNEYNSSQTCLFCFNKLSHPIHAKNDTVNIVNGTFICTHPQCPNAHVPCCRDKVSALAIGLAGMSQLLFGTTFPCFDQFSDSQRHQLFIDQALMFLEKHAQMSQH